jgi:hypothetical protein
MAFVRGTHGSIIESGNGTSTIHHGSITSARDSNTDSWQRAAIPHDAIRLRISVLYRQSWLGLRTSFNAEMVLLPRSSSHAVSSVNNVVA